MNIEFMKNFIGLEFLTFLLEYEYCRGNVKLLNRLVKEVTALKCSPQGCLHVTNSFFFVAYIF